ncbi:vWA domain-containing protein [Streptomyces sp. BE303]|uniref:vWA domain-containing protein n=1 Tax=Streptomyces sp. BE303 TaxID=3002528 RepID=UPI002E78A041|nr:vWA domain-containing protein [Streptomyces sp. BE303]MED7947870.1 VWA domain-containing protein [Streptomyces sp. BE303]
MTEAPRVTLEASYDRYRSLDEREVHVYLSVAASTAADLRASPPGDARFAEVILLDQSGSMSDPRTKLQRAKEASCAAIDTLREGTRFAVVAGTHQATMIYPRESFLAPANAVTRAEARQAVNRIAPGAQGTVIGAWLDKARELLEPHGDLICHALLLTDGRNEHQDRSARSMETVLADCRSVFTCDARGIGADWEPAELRRIAEELQGTADAVPDLADLAPDFRALIRTAMGRTLSDLALRVRCAPGVSVSVLEQAHPALADLVGHRLPLAGTAAADYPTGPWSSEARRYVATFAVTGDRTVGADAETLASVEVVTGTIGTELATPVSSVEVISARWLDQPAPETVLGADRRRHEREKELYDLRWRGGALFRQGDRPGACDAWGRAVALATELRNEDALRRLGKVVRVEDAVRGVVSLLPELDPDYVLQAMMGTATSTSYGLSRNPTTRAGSAPGRPSAPGPDCPRCGRVAVAGARYCENLECDYEFTDSSPVMGG